MNSCAITESFIEHELVVRFYSGSLNFHLNDEVAQLFSWVNQEKFLLATVQSDKLKVYPMKKDFIKQFFKKIIDFLLKHYQEIHDGFYLQLCSSMIVDNSPQKHRFYYKHYVVDNNLDEVVTIKETNNIVVNGTTGMKTWEAAVMLADWSLSNKNVFQDKNIVELGSGVGLTGIIIAKYCGPKRILLSDMHQDVLDTIAHNVSINFHDMDRLDVNDKVLFKDNRNSIEISKLDWTRLKEPSKDDVPDVMIGADIVYDPTILTPLLNVFKYYFSKNKNLVIYVESVIRNQQTFESFLTLLKSEHYKVEDIEQNGPKFLEWDDKIVKRLLKITF